MRIRSSKEKGREKKRKVSGHPLWVFPALVVRCGCCRWGDAEEQGKAPGLGCLQEWGWSSGCAGAVAQLQFIPCISQERLNPVLWPQINSSPLVRVLLQSLGKTPLIPAASGAQLLPVLGTSPASCS